MLLHYEYISCVSVFSGILSQRMFVMLPCGGVGVREKIHTNAHFIFHHNSAKLLMNAIQYTTLAALTKDDIVSKKIIKDKQQKITRHKEKERQDIKE